MGPNDIYPYAEILQRVYDSLSEKNPELLGAKKFTMIPPQVAREGSKKTVFVNFKDMCKKMHRSMEHVMSYFNAELGVPCSLDPEGKLTFKGRFTPKQVCRSLGIGFVGWGWGGGGVGGWLRCGVDELFLVYGLWYRV
jgi:translation initiation factor 2 subunit 2